MMKEKGLVCRSEESVLLLIDLQVKLAAAMDGEERALVMRNAGILTRAAALLGVPIYNSEQYPRGLGATDEHLRTLLPASATRFEKTSFSCCGADSFPDLMKSGKRQVVIAGMEAHVCVLQTALEMGAEGFEVFVVDDAVCSRKQGNRGNALDRLRQAGAIVSNTESVVFEWLHDARHEHFKEISELIR